MLTASPRVVPSLLRQMNERRVLSALQSNGPASRADLCRQTGISGPTVTRVVATLIEAKLVEEEDEPRQRAVGRPGKIVRLAGTGRKGSKGLDGPPLELELHQPHGVCVHRDGTLYISDSGNNRVLKVTKD